MGSHFSSEHFGIYECLPRKGVIPDNICFPFSQKYKHRKIIKQEKRKILKEQHKNLRKEAKAYCVLYQSCRYHSAETEGIQKLQILAQRST